MLITGFDNSKNVVTTCSYPYPIEIAFDNTEANISSVLVLGVNDFDTVITKIV